MPDQAPVQHYTEEKLRNAINRIETLRSLGFNASALSDFDLLLATIHAKDEEIDQLKEENAKLRENQRPEGGVAACDRIERERDDLARKVSDLNTALDTQGETLYLVTQERDRYKKALEEAIEFLRFRMKDGGLTASDLTLSGILHAACTNQTTNA